MLPLVSIIIPNYNHGRYLRQRMESILCQTYAHYEVIILDDHSTDNSMEVIRQYAHHERVSCIVGNETNSGSPFKQWQRGIAVAKGDIIWIAESDDYCKADMLERLVQTYIKNNCTLAFTRSLTVNDLGQPMHVCQRMFRKDQAWSGARFVKQYLNTANRIHNASSAIFSKEAAMAADPVYASFKASGDWVFWIEIARQGNVAVVSEPLNYFRRSESTCTATSTLNGIGSIEDHRVLTILKQKKLYSPYHAFLKKKRMAKYIYCQKHRYKDEQTRKKVEAVWQLPWYYWLLAKCSYLLKHA